jgi:hypothetical protein
MVGRLPTTGGLVPVCGGRESELLRGGRLLELSGGNVLVEAGGRVDVSSFGLGVCDCYAQQKENIIV